MLGVGDVASVEVSLDGGLTWWPVVQQTAWVSDWAMQVVDLSAYRGQVIALRFTLNTQGLVPEGAATVGWWIDELAIQEAPPVPTAIPTEPPTLTPVPTATPTDLPTLTPMPTSTPTEPPTEIPMEVPTGIPEMLGATPTP